MNIIVILRSVPDTLEELPLYDGELDRDEVIIKLNEFDDQALEEAVLLKEEHGGTVIALSIDMGGDRMLQMAIARGADRAVKVTGDFEEDASSRALAPVFVAAVNQLGGGLVLTGVQTPEDMFGQLVPFMAVAMDAAHASGVTSVKIDGAQINAVQEYEGGRSATLAMTLPAVLGLQAAKEPPRYISGSRLREAVQSAEIESISVDVETVPDLARIVVLRAPEEGSGAEMLSDDPDEAAEALVALLNERGLGV